MYLPDEFEIDDVPMNLDLDDQLQAGRDSIGQPTSSSEECLSEPAQTPHCRDEDREWLGMNSDEWIR